MKVVAAILCKDEADRYLTPVIETLGLYCDDILLLDDNSTDNSVEIADALGCQIRIREGGQMWGNESPARKELWDWGAEVAGTGWLLICDADQELIANPADWKMMLTSWNVHSWAFPLYDCWDGKDQFRADGHWRGYQYARPWLFRPSACPNPVWSTRGIHTGHCPANFPGPVGLAPKSVYWKHYGWLEAEGRQEKVRRYLSAKEQLTPEELAHLTSAGE